MKDNDICEEITKMGSDNEDDFVFNVLTLRHLQDIQKQRHNQQWKAGDIAQWQSTCLGSMSLELMRGQG
jgi:hypothetical protein